MRIAMLYGRFSSSMHGEFNPNTLYKGRALTGSESSFFNVARGLSELGHEIIVYCDTNVQSSSCVNLAGATVMHIDNDPEYSCDAYLSWNEPDQFRRLPKNVHGLRVVSMQLNDYNPVFASAGFENFVDIHAFVSPVQRQHLLSITPQIQPEKTHFIPNSINLDLAPPRNLFENNNNNRDKRKPHSMIWCSSPDRGLHRLLELFPEIKKRVPGATLDIYYRFEPWYEALKDDRSEMGARARYIGEALTRFGRKGENGVTLHGPVANNKMAEALCNAQVMPYTCDPITFTEGFSVSTMDACALGCIPIISDVDAIGDIYKNVAYVIEGPVRQRKTQWVDAIVRAMTDKTFASAIAKRTRIFAERFDRAAVSRLWEILLSENADRKDGFSFSTLPRTIADYAVPKSPPEVACLFSSNEPPSERGGGVMSDEELKNLIKSSTPSANKPAQTEKPHQRWIKNSVPQIPSGTAPEGQTWIELGGADAPHSFHPNVDIRQMPGVDIVHDLTKMPLPFDEGHADQIKSVHLLNHLPFVKAQALLADSLRVLKPGSKLTIIVTDLEFSIKRVLEDGPVSDWMNCIYGTEGNTYEHDFHYWGYTPKSLCSLLEEIGYEKAEYVQHYQPWEFEVHAFKKSLPTKKWNFKGHTIESVLDPTFEETDIARNEPQVKERWWHIEPGDVVLDIGAAHGAYTLTALAQGASHVFSWAPENYAPILRENLRLNRFSDRCTVFESGLWQQKGFLHPNFPHLPLFTPEHAPLPLDGMFPVEALDESKAGAQVEKLGHIDWIKIDAEGAEVEILRGACDLITKYKPKILTENHTFKSADIADKTAEFLKQLGYREIDRVPYTPDVSHSLFEPENEVQPKPKAPAISKNLPEVSVLVSTFRPGGLDLTFAGMRDQTHRDFEVILVDKRYEKRKHRVDEYKRKFGDFRFIHAPEHRSNGKWVTFCSAWNTAIALARGKYVIFHQDYAYAPPGWIEKHIEAIANNPKRVAIGPYDYYDFPELDLLKPHDVDPQKCHAIGDRCTDLDPILTDDILDELFVFKGPFDPSWLKTLTIGADPRYADKQWRECRQAFFDQGAPVKGDWLHVKNESCTRDFIYALNGLDERLERGKGPMDIDLGIRIENAGGELYWHGNCPRPSCINPRFFCRNHPWGAMHERLEGRWSFDDGMHYNKLVQSRKAYYAQNPYRMEDLSRRLESWRKADAPKIAQNLSDLAYWGSEIWPDTPPYLEP